MSCSSAAILIELLLADEILMVESRGKSFLATNHSQSNLQAQTFTDNEELRNLVSSISSTVKKCSSSEAKEKSTLSLDYVLTSTEIEHTRTAL